MITPDFTTRPQQVDDMVCDAIVALLANYCRDSIVNLPLGSAYAATVVRQGLLQEDPVKDRIAILVNPCDPDSTADSPGWEDERAHGDQNGWFIPTAHIGGGGWWWRRLMVDVEVYLIRTQEGRPTAREIGLWVIGRVDEAISENPGLAITDDFGETAIWMVTEKMPIVQSGGPPNDFIWRAKLYVRVMTEKP